MRDELSGIASAIEARSLPISANELFGPMWDAEDGIFRTQETYIIDFKDRAPTDFANGFGASIVRLALAFHNSYGGIIVFGVNDSDFAPIETTACLNVEAFNDLLTDLTNSRIECISREYKLDGVAHRIQVLLVPRRGITKPLRINRNFDKYKVGTVWVRDRHSVREASEDSLAVLYSDRRDLAYSLGGDLHRSIHESLPPSPSTMDEFIGRMDLLDELWNWFVFGNKPRLYLHGPGGSGKSTLAYEFSRQVAERGDRVRFANGDNLDYVIYISGKETELNPYSASEQPFVLRQFDDSSTQFQAILVDSGMRSKDEAKSLDEEGLIAALNDLFSTYAGLIVIDDVDALSRRSKDTGEESLLFACLSAQKRTRVLYTLRFPPSSALNSSVKVPELEEASEFPKFVEACARQFSVEVPPEALRVSLAKATSKLPLLTETVIGLRKVCGSYQNALQQFDARGGEEARRYLYQREYDRLDPKGRSREVLSALFLLDDSVTFSVLKRILNIPDNEVRDSLTECGSVFLSAKDSGKGETHYQLATPAKSFIAGVSNGLKLYPVIKRRVELFRAEDAAFTPEESALIVQMERLIRDKAFVDIIQIFETRDPRDPVTANHKVQALVGQAYSNLGPDYRTKARECFSSAHELNYFDIFMARAWFHVESFAEYGNRDAIDVCDKVLAQPKLSTRHKAEFKSKKANCYLEEARRSRNTSPERAILYFRESIDGYLSSLWIGRYFKELDEHQTLRWLTVPARGFVDFLGQDLEPFFDMLEKLPDRGHDIHPEGARVIIDALRRTQADRDIKSRAKLAGLMRRTAQRLQRFIGNSENYSGFEFLARTLSTAHTHLTASARPPKSAT